MEKIVPFKKIIDFEGGIYEVCSISLEHTLSLKEEKHISGKFIISGTYKAVKSSLDTIDFEYDLPFDIGIDSKYETKDVKADINNFYYEIVDNKALSVSIDVLIENIFEREDIVESVRNVNTIENEADDIKEDKIDNKEDSIDTLNEREDITETVFDSLDENEKYSTYKVHVISENDTTESIIQKYEVSISDLEKYNDLSDLKIGDKVIVPSNE